MLQLDCRPLERGGVLFPSVTTFAVSGKYWNRVVERWDGVYKAIRESAVLEILILVEDEEEEEEKEKGGQGEAWKLVETKKGSGPAVCDLRRGVWRERKKEELWEKWDRGRVYEMRGPVVEIKFARLKMCEK